MQFDQFFPETRSILKFGFPYYCGTALLFSLINFPLIGLVSRYAGLEQVGYVRVAQSVGALVGIIPGAIAPATIAYLSASVSDTAQQDQHTYLKSLNLRIIWIMLLLSNSGVCLILPILITFLFGSAYRPAILLTWLFLWSSLLTGITEVLIQYLVVNGQTTRIAGTSLVSASCWVFSGVLLIPQFGALGFFLAYLIGSIIEVPLMLSAALSNIASDDFNYIKNLTILSFVLVGWTSLIFLFNLADFHIYLLTGGTLAVTSSLLFIYAFSSREKTQISKTINLLWHR